MRHPVIHMVVPIFVFQSCASLPSQNERMLMSAGAGGAMGGAAGAILSPNQESRGMNALVFGLSGALAGAAIGLLLPSPTETSKKDVSLEERERMGSVRAHDYTVLPKEDLPDFLKKRMSPTVVEEFIETDQVGEDGSLHAPHKVYRIKHPAELIAAPNESEMLVK